MNSTQLKLLSAGLVFVLSGCPTKAKHECDVDNDCSIDAHCQAAECVLGARSVSENPSAPPTSTGGEEPSVPFAFQVLVPAPQPRVVPDVGVVISQEDATSFLRSESVDVQVRANRAWPDGGATFTVTGVGGDKATTLAVTPVTCADGVDAGACGVARVDLSQPSLNGLRGAFRADIAVAGAEAQSVRLPVTRVKWVLQLQAPLKATPAIKASNGTVYVASAAADGKVVALNPDGTPAWPSPFDTGRVLSSPALGQQGLYVAQALENSWMYVLNSETGVARKRCGASDSSPVPGAIEASLALASGDGDETAVGVAANAFSVMSFRPARLSDGCLNSPSPTQTQFPGNVVSNGDRVFFSLSGVVFNCRFGLGFELDVGAWFLGRSGEIGSASQFLPGLALVGGSVVGANDAFGPFQVDVATGAAQVGPSALYLGTPSNAAIGKGNSIYVADRSPSLMRISVGSAPSAKVSIPARVIAAPLLGEKSLVYTADTAGLLSVRSADLGLHWDAALPSTSGFSASPTIDCARDARGTAVSGPGALYLAAEDGKFYSILVDSHGLDSTAPWPKYQHDEANSGNSTKTAQRCP